MMVANSIKDLVVPIKTDTRKKSINFHSLLHFFVRLSLSKLNKKVTKGEVQMSQTKIVLIVRFPLI